MSKPVLIVVAALLLLLPTSALSQSQESDSTFFLAASTGDTATLAAYLAKGFNINSQDQYWQGTALHVAITYASFPTVRYLLRHGADVNAADSAGTTPLILAARLLDRRVVKHLLAAGANPQLTDTAGYTALAEAGDGHTIRMLATAGLDVNHESHPGETPILRAAGQLGLDAVLVLLSLGADPNRQPPDGISPLLFAVYERNLSKAQALINAGALVNAPSNEGGSELKTPLMAAAEQDHLEMVSLLLAAGADATLRDAAGKSASEYAVGRNRSAITQALTNADSTSASFRVSPTMFFVAAQTGDTVSLMRCMAAKVNAWSRDQDGVSALEHAASFGHAPIIRCLIARNANVKVGSSDTLLPLRKAVDAGHVEAVDALIQAGARVTYLDSDSTSMLIVAATQGHKGVVERLIAAGAPIDTRNKFGMTALNQAKFYGDDVVVALLRAAGAREPTTVYLAQPDDGGYHSEFFAAAANGDLETVRRALAAGLSVNTLERIDNSTALIFAACGGHTAIVKELVSRGAEMEAEDDKAVTALICAIYNVHNETAKALLAAGAKPNTITWEGKTALNMSCRMGNVELTKSLLKAGADVNLAFKGTTTPLINAVSSQEKKVVELLLKQGADVNAQGWSGVSPMAVAANNNLLEIAKMLLAAGARTDLPMTGEFEGQTALSQATSKGYMDMVKLLETAE